MREDTAELYQIIHDYIKQNPMQVQDVIGMLMTIMLEFAMTAYATSADDEEEE